MRIFLLVFALLSVAYHQSSLAQEQFVSMHVTTGNIPTANGGSVTLDRISAKIMPYSYRNVGGKFVGEGTSKGLEQPCIFRFRFRSQSGKDSLSLQMDKAGPLTEATYGIVPGDAPEKVQGKFIGEFALDTIKTGSKAEAFRVKSGSLTIEKIVGDVVEGHLTINGASGPTSYNDTSTTEPPTIVAKFSIRASGIVGPYKEQPFACLEG